MGKVASVQPALGHAGGCSQQAHETARRRLNGLAGWLVVLSSVLYPACTARALSGCESVPPSQ